MTDLLQSIAGTGTDWTVYLLLALVFGTVALAVFGMSTLVTNRTSLKERVGAAGAPGTRAALSSGAGSISLSHDGGGSGSRGPIAKRFIPTELSGVLKTPPDPDL